MLVKWPRLKPMGLLLLALHRVYRRQNLYTALQTDRQYRENLGFVRSWQTPMDLGLENASKLNLYSVRQRVADQYKARISNSQAWRILKSDWDTNRCKWSAQEGYRGGRKNISTNLNHSQCVYCDLTSSNICTSTIDLSLKRNPYRDTIPQKRVNLSNYPRKRNFRKEKGSNHHFNRNEKFPRYKNSEPYRTRNISNKKRSIHSKQYGNPKRFPQKFHKNYKSGRNYVGNKTNQQKQYSNSKFAKKPRKPNRAEYRTENNFKKTSTP